MSTSSPRIFPAKNRQVGEDDIKSTSSPRTFTAKTDQMGRTTFYLPPPQGREKGAKPKPIKGVRLS